MKFGDASLQLLVDVLSTADEADTTHTEAMSIDSFFGSFTDSGVIRQSQIVVSAEVEDTLPPLNFNLGALRASDDSFNLVSTGILYALKSLLACLVKLYKTGSNFLLSLLCEKSLLLVSCIISFIY